MRPIEPTGLPGTRIVLGEHHQDQLIAHATGERIYMRWSLDEGERRAIVDGAAVELITWTYGQRFQPVHLRVQGVEVATVSEGSGRVADLEELRKLVSEWMERPSYERVDPTYIELFDNAVRPLLRRTER